MKNINYKIKRRIVKFKQKRHLKNVTTCLNKLNSEQLPMFKMVEDIARNNNSNIVFDPHSSEIIISLPKILIIFEQNKITIHNSNGFFSVELTFDSSELLKKIIYKEAHKDRRKLKHQAKLRLQNFLNNVKNEI